MTPSPIRKALSTLAKHQVLHLLMGGQACVLYGGAEFSRDADVAVLADVDNLSRLSLALSELQAPCVALPPFDRDYLLRGHAIHFRCQHPEARGLRIDVMSVMRGVDSFAELWERRSTLQLDDGTTVELMSLPDLVKAKKTQRDKDWPMIRRLVEANYARNQLHPNSDQVRFWLQECRTASILRDVASRYPAKVVETLEARPLLSLASSSEADLESALAEEEKQAREQDRAYWRPLRRELEELRHAQRKGQPPAGPIFEGTDS